MLARMWGKRNPHILLMGMIANTTTMENIMEDLKNQKIELPYDPTIPFLRIYLKECKSG
jgi:hypothetical protein